MSQKLFVVVALHSTGHGPGASVLHVTESIVDAYHSLHNARELGYKMYREDYVAICSVMTERPIAKKDEYSKTMLVAHCYNNDGQFTEEWFDENTRQTLKGVGLL